jgi:hypothetical protein
VRSSKPAFIDNLYRNNRRPVKGEKGAAATRMGPGQKKID